MHVQEQGMIRKFSVGVYDVMKAGEAKWDRSHICLFCSCACLVPVTKLGVPAAMGTGIKTKHLEMQIQI